MNAQELIEKVGQSQDGDLNRITTAFMLAVVTREITVKEANTVLRAIRKRFQLTRSARLA